MASEEADESHPAEIGSACALRGGLFVSKQEWEQIEDVPQKTRRVGIMFQRAAEEVLQQQRQKVGPVVCDSLEGPVETGYTFDAGAYAIISGEEAPKKKSKEQPAKKKIDQIREKLRANLWKEDQARARASSARKSPPQLEAYGGRLESFIYAVFLWLEKQKPVVKSLVSACVLRYCSARAVILPRQLLGKLQSSAEAEGYNISEALNDICDDEGLLALTPSLGEHELSLYPEQADFVKEVMQALQSDEPLLLRYQTPPSGGKTSASALLGAALMPQTEVHILYTCYSRQVRIDVCKHLLAASVPFAIVTLGVASPSYSCYFQRAPKNLGQPPSNLAERAEFSLRRCRMCDRFPVVLVCDLPSTLLLLQHKSRFVLLFDEPTADVADGMRADVLRVLRTSPRFTVLMSATVPDFEQMPGFVAGFRERHGPAKAVTISSERLPMSITARDESGKVWAPHMLGVDLSTIEREGHLRRFYSPQVLKSLNPCDGEITACDLHSYESIRQAFLRILRRRLAESQPGPALPGISLQQKKGDEYPELLELTKLCTSQASFVPGASLLYVASPQDFCTASLSANLRDLPTLRRLLKAEASSKQPKSKGPTSALEAKQVLEDERMGWETSSPGGFWPLACVINSKEHAAKHRGRASALPEKWMKAQVHLPDHVCRTTETALVEAALSGVLMLGDTIDRVFETAAHALAEQALETYILSDRQLIYGINFPIERVIVAGPALHYQEMKQLCGRAGRTGRTAKAEVVFLDAASLRAALIPPSQGEIDQTTLSCLNAF